MAINFNICKEEYLLKKEDLIKKSINNNLKSKEEILKNILSVVREEEKIESKRDDLNILVLSLIQRKDMYGYEVIKEIEIKSQGTFSMNEGEVYPILHFLENKRFIESYWKIDDHIEKKYYSITKTGREYLLSKSDKISEIGFLDAMKSVHKMI